MSEKEENISSSEVDKEIDDETPDNDASDDSSEVDTDVIHDIDMDAYNIWKSNTQYLYDLLMYSHTNWPLDYCAWGKIGNEGEISPVTPLSQVVISTTHTGNTKSFLLIYIEGHFKADTNTWENMPEYIDLSSMEMTRRRGTQPWYVGKFNETKRKRSTSSILHIIHPGSLTSLK
jgi:hypothetical protein